MAVKYPFLHLYIRWYKYKLIFWIVQNRNININWHTYNRYVVSVNLHWVKHCKRRRIWIILLVSIFFVSYWRYVYCIFYTRLFCQIFTFTTLFMDIYLKFTENRSALFVWLSLSCAIQTATNYSITISAVIFIYVNRLRLYSMHIYNFNVYILNTDWQKQTVYNCIMYRIVYRAHLRSSIRLWFSIKDCHPDSVDQERILQLCFLAIFPYPLCRTLKNWILTEFKLA